IELYHLKNIKMRIKTFIILSLLFSFGCSTYEASYEQSPLTIDGLSSDWTTTLDSRNNNSFMYGISNDNENIYIRININDQSIQKKLILAGLTVWVDTTGKKNMGIICPTQKSLPKMDRSKMKQMQSQQTWKKDQLLEIDFMGFREYRESYTVSKNPYGVEVSIDQDEFKSLYYEMKIPFKSIYSDYSDLTLKTLSIGFETGALKMPSSGNSHAGRSNQSGGISGGGKGGGRAGMSGSGRNGAAQHSTAFSKLTTPTSFWVKKINLASN
ncbi:MAG: hypothetical protein KOO66_06980, partial [Bacteroidales bacterium]|nr:hypothetical protein [Bacteroidales bacterium]